MKLYFVTIALLSVSVSVIFAQNETTVETTTQSFENSTEISTDSPTTLAPEDGKVEGNTNDQGPKEPELKIENPMNFNGRPGGPFFPHPNDPRIMFVPPNVVRDPVTGMVYHHRAPHFVPPHLHYRQPMHAPTQPSFDPLGSFTEHQKKRQFFQDLLMTQLSRFEKEVDPMMDQETEESGKATLVSILSAVNNLKKILENNQIFNISEIMKTWKEGKLPGQTAPPTESGPITPQTDVSTPSSAQIEAQSEQTPAEVVAVAEANSPVRAILLLPQRQRESTFVLQREPQQPWYIRRFAVRSQDEPLISSRNYAPQHHGYIGDY